MAEQVWESQEQVTQLELTMRVLGDNVLVEQDPPTNLKGLLYVPQGKEEFPPIGTVRATGPDVRDVKPGDRVVFKRKPDSAITPEGRPGEAYYGLLVLPEEHILALVED